MLRPLHEKKGSEGSHGGLQGRGSCRRLCLARSGKMPLMSAAICASLSPPTPHQHRYLFDLGLQCPGRWLLQCCAKVVEDRRRRTSSQLHPDAGRHLSPTWESRFGSCFPGACERVEEGGLTFSCLCLGLSSFRNGHWHQSWEMLALVEQDQNDQGLTAARCPAFYLLLHLRDGTAAVFLILSALPCPPFRVSNP